MRMNMDPLAPTTSTLAPAIAHIAGTAEGLATTLKRVHGPEIKIPTSDNFKSIKSKNKKEVETVRWAITAPQRYQVMIDKDDRLSAEEDWQEVEPLLQKWGRKGIDGVEEIRKNCLEVLGLS
jgi:vacuolar protein sorting-associated protein 51